MKLAGAGQKTRAGAPDADPPGGPGGELRPEDEDELSLRAEAALPMPKLDLDPDTDRNTNKKRIHSRIWHNTKDFYSGLGLSATEAKALAAARAGRIMRQLAL